MVLLKNDGILPINVTSFKSVTLIGPCADDADCNTGINLHLFKMINVFLSL